MEGMQELPSRKDATAENVIRNMGETADGNELKTREAEELEAAVNLIKAYQDTAYDSLDENTKNLLDKARILIDNSHKGITLQ